MSPEVFAAERPHLIGVAYRLLGSVAEAEDAVQEAFLRARDVADDEVASPRAYLATVVTRLCLDTLRSARVRREKYVGPWLPEPLGESMVVEPRDPESISIALLRVLESLSPLERAVFVLHEAFDYENEEIAIVLGKEPANVRQLLHRAREHMRANRPRFAPTREDHERMLIAFATAAGQGDVAALEKLLASDVALRTDGGGRVHAARNVIHGANAAARGLIGVTRKTVASEGVLSYALRTINGMPTLVWSLDGVVVGLVSIETDGALIHAVDVVVNPEKLAHVA